ncbi:MAG: hypothetical protein HYZ77_04220, partial [Serratia liquefaciens]|nr:hypothetical protein [Serratia liquefaciens]
MFQIFIAANNTHTASAWDCCHPSSQTDAEGVTTTYDLYDALGQVLQETRVAARETLDQ